jgi:hypothetical protein
MIRVGRCVAGNYYALLSGGTRRAMQAGLEVGFCFIRAGLGRWTMMSGLRVPVAILAQAQGFFRDKRVFP